MLVKTSFLNPNFVCDVLKAESIVANALKKILCFFKSSGLSALDFQESSFLLPLNASFAFNRQGSVQQPNGRLLLLVDSSSTDFRFTCSGATNQSPPKSTVK